MAQRRAELHLFEARPREPGKILWITRKKNIRGDYFNRDFERGRRSAAAFFVFKQSAAPDDRGGPAPYLLVELKAREIDVALVSEGRV